jgi:putative transposase
MHHLQAFKFELMPNGEQQRNMRRFAGWCRFVFNKALALQKDRLEAGKKNPGYAELGKNLTDWKCQLKTIWLSETPSPVLQLLLEDLEQAYINLSAKRTKLPRFKKKSLAERFRVLGMVKNVTVNRSCGKWLVSIQIGREEEQPFSLPTTVMGIDLGIARFATSSDGTFFAPLNSFRQQALTKAQRALSRKQKFSNNWKKKSACQPAAISPTQNLDCNQPKLRDDVYRGFAGA